MIESRININKVPYSHLKSLGFIAFIRRFFSKQSTLIGSGFSSLNRFKSIVSINTMTDLHFNFYSLVRLKDEFLPQQYLHLSFGSYLEVLKILLKAEF